MQLKIDFLGKITKFPQHPPPAPNTNFCGLFVYVFSILNINILNILNFQYSKFSIFYDITKWQSIRRYLKTMLPISLLKSFWRIFRIKYEPKNYRCNTLCELTGIAQGRWHWHKSFLIRTSNIFISSITRIVVNLKCFKSFRSSY